MALQQYFKLDRAQISATAQVKETSIKLHIIQFKTEK